MICQHKDGKIVLGEIERCTNRTLIFHLRGRRMEFRRYSGAAIQSHLSVTLLFATFAATFRTKDDPSYGNGGRNDRLESCCGLD